MSAPSDRVLAPAELHALSHRANLPGALRLGVHAALLIGTGWWLAVAGPWGIVPAFLAFGLTQVALFAPAHEMMHQTAFASRRANAIFGWLAACPSLLNLQFYTSFHLAHHRHTQIPGADPELDLAPTDTVWRYVVRVLGVPYWRLRLRVIRDCWRGDLRAYPYVSRSAAPGVIRSVRAMSVVMVGGAVALGVLFWVARAVAVLDRSATAVSAVPAGLCAGRAHRLHAGSQWADQYAHHADQRGGAAADVEHAVSRRAPSVSVDPVPSAGGGACDVACSVGFRATRVCAVALAVGAGGVDGWRVSVAGLSAGRWLIGQRALTLS